MDELVVYGVAMFHPIVDPKMSLHFHMAIPIQHASHGKLHQEEEKQVRFASPCYKGALHTGHRLTTLGNQMPPAQTSTVHRVEGQGDNFA